MRWNCYCFLPWGILQCVCHCHLNVLFLICGVFKMVIHFFSLPACSLGHYSCRWVFRCVKGNQTGQNGDFDASVKPYKLQCLLMKPVLCSFGLCIFPLIWNVNFFEYVFFFLYKTIVSWLWTSIDSENLFLVTVERFFVLIVFNPANECISFVDISSNDVLQENLLLLTTVRPVFSNGTTRLTGSDGLCATTDKSGMLLDVKRMFRSVQFRGSWSSPLRARALWTLYGLDLNWRVWSASALSSQSETSY